MNHLARHYVLTVTCPDTIDIVAAVAGFLSRERLFITDTAHFGDPVTGRFFMRVVFRDRPGMPPLADLNAAFADVGQRFQMEWRIRDHSVKPRLLVLVSRFDHCLNGLLARYRSGTLRVDIPAVVSNHPDLRSVVEWHGIPFHHLPVTNESRAAQEADILAMAGRLGIDLVVLARYMQVLSPEMCRALSWRCINIHHSFLPSFKGALPYRQAHARGVKIIGATAHYVTTDLDEGPIIEQGVERVDHSHSADDLAHIGRDIESVVLCRAVDYHTQDRVLPNGGKTVVFRR
jgi:formyltetrahydrofolate deformylase